MSGSLKYYWRWTSRKHRELDRLPRPVLKVVRVVPVLYDELGRLLVPETPDLGRGVLGPEAPLGDAHNGNYDRVPPGRGLGAELGDRAGHEINEVRHFVGSCVVFGCCCWTYVCLGHVF